MRIYYPISSGIDLNLFPTLHEHFNSIFDSSKNRIKRLVKDGNLFIGDLENFRKVFKQRNGKIVSTIHGVKGEEYDTMIGFVLLNIYVLIKPKQNLHFL